jgi:transcriptional/translational regulatory protein YebC/TACO1
MFSYKGQIVIVGKNLSDDHVIEAALEAGAEDVISPDPLPDEDEEGGWTVLTDIPSFTRVKAALEKARLPIEEASLAMIPQDTVALTDVQKVYTNAG